MARAKPKPAGPTPVETVVHQDKRRNIPTGQQAHLVEQEESNPAEVRYPRDPSLDPQLVWKGKDIQDAADLVVPAVPIYIQEKLDPRALVENLRDTAAPGQREPELTLFADFDGFADHLDALDLVDFYRHEGNWHNRMILGDSLVVMTSLAEKENLQGQVQMVFIDPPYGIKFGSNWQSSTRKREVGDGKTEDASREPEVIKAFRDTWELGIHSYLAYLRDRLMAARELLNTSGSVFVQIGDENLHLVRSLMDEVFGSANFCSVIVYSKTAGTTGALLPGTADFLLWYAKDITQVKYRKLYGTKELGGSSGVSLYTHVELPDGTRRPMTAAERAGSQPLPEGSRVFGTGDLTSPRVREARTGYYPVELDGESYLPRKGEWKTNRAGMERLVLARRVARSGQGLGYVRFIDDFPAYPLGNVWTDTVGQNQYGGDKVYVVQTANKAVQRCLLMTTDPGDLVLDPTCGSGTTAYVAEQWGRRWITTDTSRVALALARTRLMSAKFPYYVLADSAEGAGKDGAAAGRPSGPFNQDVRKGFVYKRIPHVTLKSIAQNPDIQAGMTSEAIDAAIARSAESEVLVDQPLEDKKRVRVTGRFTVESLSPHRMLTEEASDADAAISADPQVVQFETMMLDNLRKAGVQNTFKDERLQFDRLEPLAGHQWLHAEGEYTEADGNTRRVAVSLGPEFGTVGSEQVALAAQEATRRIPYDVLLVTGFAFDPQAWAKAKEINPDVAERRLGRLRVLLTRANPDLAMGGELLKKTGAGNLFSIFGEPDIDIRRDDGQVTVEIRGLDVYDPTTGAVRSASTDDIACWFIDTNYDSTSFFVRHAYFTGGQEPYDNLAKTLRAEINPDVWASLYSTVSRPFPVPETGRIAVKVINHYGDEVLQIYEVT